MSNIYLESIYFLIIYYYYIFWDKLPPVPPLYLQSCWPLKSRLEGSQGVTAHLQM
jgi:hypothetical protein